MWIAFRIYYLCDTSQPTYSYFIDNNGCELLSEFIIFVIHHNSPLTSIKQVPVVNCFQNLLSLWYITTRHLGKKIDFRLWIAFRIYYLCDTSQQIYYFFCYYSRCELLSEFIIFVIHHNFNNQYKRTYNVVNCFQNLLSLWYITTCSN